MGIKLLNSLIRKECKQANKLTTLYQLKGKKIVIDTSIYLYRFKSAGNLMENMYLLCSILRYYNIIPLFVFDGIPSQKKSEELKDRKKQKIAAKKEYDILKESGGKQQKMKKLRRIFTTVNREDIKNVKKLLNLYGLTYVNAEEEADELCAKLVICEKAYACLSEDTDLFVYGCPRVLRYLSLRKHTAILYTLDKMLEELKLSQPIFREMCVISGTDYNKSSQNVFYYYDIYKRGARLPMTDEEKKIYNIFDLKKEDVFDDLLIKNETINKTGIINLMEKYNFIFT